jgi:heme/copper-type cytochrome/quinol oxidase subunit 3
VVVSTVAIGYTGLGPYSLSCIHGTVGVLLYWHLVDGIWVLVVCYLYSSTGGKGRRPPQ